MESKLRISLLALRLSVCLVLLFWTVDKFVRPEHAAGVYEHFYHLTGIGPGVMAALAIAEAILILGFLVGVGKRFTYGFVFVIHGVSTISALQKYLQPFEKLNLLFFTAWPMWAACLTLYLLRNEDTLWTFSGKTWPRILRASS